MRLLLDTCVWAGAAAVPRTAGHDVVYAGDWSVDPGDEEIISRAAGEGRVLITLDKDFGELVVVRRRSHAGIVRLVGFLATVQGAIITAEPGRIRLRPPEPDDS